MGDYLSVADLFVVGLGLDVVGGYLLARGLLVPPKLLAIRSTDFWGSNPSATVGMAEDRVDGWFGVASLLSGFCLQALGYSLISA